MKESVSLSIQLKKKKKAFWRFVFSAARRPSSIGVLAHHDARIPPRSSTRYDLVVTTGAVYIFTGGKYDEKHAERRMSLRQIRSILLEKASNRFVFHLWEGDPDASYEAQTSDDRTTIARHVACQCFNKTNRAPEEVTLSAAEIETIFRTEEKIEESRERAKSEGVMMRASMVSSEMSDAVSEMSSSSAKDLLRLIKTVEIPGPAQKYFGYLLGEWPTQSDAEIARIVAEMIISESGRKILVTHCKSTATNFAFLTDLIDILAKMMVMPNDAEVRRWSALSVYVIQSMCEKDKTLRELVVARADEDGIVNALIQYDFPLFYGSMMALAPFEAIDYNMLLEIALNKVRSPKTLQDVTADAKVEPWNAPIANGGCCVLELGMRLRALREIECIQECVTDWFVLLMRSAANMRHVLLEDHWARFVLPAFTRVSRDKDARDDSEKDVLNKAAAVYAKLLCFSFEESDKVQFEKHMKSLFDEITTFNGWAEDAGQVARIICYKVIGTIKKSASSWASDMSDKRWSAIFALCEVLEEMIIHRPYAACESAFGRTVQSTRGSNIELLRVYGVNASGSSGSPSSPRWRRQSGDDGATKTKDDDAAVHGEVVFKSVPLLRIKPVLGFLEPPPGAEVHLNAEGMCVDAHLAQLVVNLLTKTLKCTGDVEAASNRGRSKAERANWEFAEQLTRSFMNMVAIFKMIHKERDGKKGSDLVTLSDEVMSKVTEWCYERAKRRSSGFFSFFGGPSKSQIAVALRECQLHRKAHFRIRVATKQRATQMKQGHFKPPETTPAQKAKMKISIAAAAKRVQHTMVSATPANRLHASRKVDHDEAAETKSAACAGCSKVAILTDLIQLEGEWWHPQCFTCQNCSKQLLKKKKKTKDTQRADEDSKTTDESLEYDSQYFTRDDKRWCQSCFVKTYAKHTCAGCLEPLMPDVSPVSACGKLWHPKCFKCEHCNVGLVRHPFVISLLLLTR